MAEVDSSGISFTALYTGHTWYRQGWSKGFLTNPKAALLYQSLRPFNWAMEKTVGFNIDEVLVLRHQTMDLRIKELIEREGITQIVEIACGLSPRGLMFSEAYPELKYIEADLPAMAAKKRALLSANNGLKPNHQVVACDIFDRQVDHSLDALLGKNIDLERPTIVITEGLVNYFTLTNISDFWFRLARLLKKLPKAYYMSDLLLEPLQFPLKEAVHVAGKALALLTRADVTFHFHYCDEVIRHFEALGFSSCLLFRPEDLDQAGHGPVNRAGNSTINSTSARIFIVEARVDSK